MKIIEKTFDASTNEETMTEREETQQETAHRLALENQKADYDAAKAAKAAAAASAVAKLSTFGLTLEEIEAIRG